MSLGFRIENVPCLLEGSGIDTASAICAQCKRNIHKSQKFEKMPKNTYFLNVDQLPFLLISWDTILADEEIIRGYLEGNTKDYGVIVGWIREVVNTRLWVQGVSAEDIVSDTTHKLLLNFRAKKFKFESALKTYVQRITRYTIIDTIRSYRRAKEYLTEENVQLLRDKNPLEIFESKEDVFIFNRIFSLVDETCRKLWNMIFHECLSYKDIAKKLNITEGVVKTKVFRCKEEAIAIKDKIT